MGLRQAISRHRHVLAICVLVQVALGVIATRAWLAEHNTLHANGRWISTKVSLDRGLLGAFSYTTTLNALAKGRLHLNAWHGFNEVVLAEAIGPASSIEFDLKLGSYAWLVVGFNRPAEGAYDAVRLSTHAAMPSAFLRVDERGAFTTRQPLAHPLLEAPAQVRIRLEFDGQVVRVLADGMLQGEFPTVAVDEQTISWRGGLREASVDSVKVVHQAGVLLEDFDAPPASLRLYLATVAAVVALNMLLFALLWRGFGAEDGFLGFRLLMIDLTLLAVGAILYVYVVQGTTWYPRMGEVLAQAEAYFRKGEMATVMAEIESRHSLSYSAGQRLLFIGASQTWGAGAAEADEAWVRVLESNLNRDGTTGPVECINAGISSLRARDFEPILAGLLAYKPDIVVINLSSNDRVRSFIHSIRRLARESLAAGADVVLVQEANTPSSGRKGLEARHAELASVATELNLVLIDLDGLLSRQNETGFLWWDRVHLTSFGQELVADEMARELKASGVLSTSTE